MSTTRDISAFGSESLPAKGRDQSNIRNQSMFTFRTESVVDFVAGTIGGIIGLAVGFPLDTVKVRFQDPATASKYRSGTLAAIVRIIREERVFGLFKGITSPMAGCAFLNGLVFSSYGFLLRMQLGRDSDEPSLGQISLAGAGSGIVASLVTCPTELIKIRQQAIISSRPTARDITRNIFRNYGIRGLYQGMTITALRDTGYGAYFVTYESLCRYLRSSDSKYSHTSLTAEVGTTGQEISWPRLMFAGGVAGVIGWLATFGLDVVKTRIQANPSKNRIWSVVLRSYQADGLSVFFIGLAPTLMRAIPVNMATFGAFELVKSLA